jgi:hypothetical protein
MNDDTTSLCAALFGLAGFEVLAAADVGGELELLVATTVDLVGCPTCAAVARGEGPAPDVGAGSADRRPAGGAVLVEAGLVVPAAAVRAAHLDRAAPGDRAASGADRAGPGVGVRAGRGGGRGGVAHRGGWGWRGGR